MPGFERNSPTGVCEILNNNSSFFKQQKIIRNSATSPIHILNKHLHPKKTTKFGAKDYMIKEAEMIISNYLSDIENEKRLKSMRIDKIELKYKRLKALTFILGIITTLTTITRLI